MLIILRVLLGERFVDYIEGNTLEGHDLKNTMPFLIFSPCL